jgi:catechol 2,3-dioxygenase-like lactoylglutathione lyase family enzyme
MIAPPPGEDAMIDHISVAVADLKKSAAFYDPLLETLGMRRVADRENTIGYGKRYPEFWLNARPAMHAVAADTGVHICLRARTTDIVDAFHAAALANGGADDGAPGPRRGEMTEYYGAFVRDPDGNKIEVATFPPKE